MDLVEQVIGFHTNNQIVIRLLLGKTTFIESLITSNHINKKWKTIYYCYPYELGLPPVDWDSEFSDVNVEFLTDLPDIQFFDTMERSSLVIFDDLWVECCKSPDIIKSFKVNCYL